MSPRAGLSASAKTGIGVLIVFVALIVALVMTVLGDGAPGDDGNGSAQSAPAATADDAGPGGAVRESGGSSGGAAADSDTPLAGITLTDLGDGRPVDLSAELAGRPAVINLWAYWCGPCRAELPAMEQFARQAGEAVTVLAVHSDPHTDKGRALLRELGVHLDAVADPDRAVAAAVRAPQVLPVTVLVRADGSVAKVVAIPFTDAADIAQVVEDTLGVTL